MNGCSAIERSRVTRRQSLLAFAVPLLGTCARAATTSDPVDAAVLAARRWVQLLTDGDKAYWLTQGTEFVIIDGVTTPVKARVGVIAARSRPRADGGHRVSYLLHGCNVSPEVQAIGTPLRHPVTGEPIPVVAGAPLRLGLDVAADGAISEDLLAANGTLARYRGRAWMTPGFGTESVVTAKLDIRLERPGGAVEALAETSQLHASQAGGSPQEDIDVRSETMTTREVVDKRNYKGRLAYTVSLTRGIRFAKVESLREMLPSHQTQTLKDFFEQQDVWVRNG